MGGGCSCLPDCVSLAPLDLPPRSVRHQRRAGTRQGPQGRQRQRPPGQVAATASAPPQSLVRAPAARQPRTRRPGWARPPGHTKPPTALGAPPPPPSLAGSGPHPELPEEAGLSLGHFKDTLRAAHRGAPVHAAKPRPKGPASRLSTHLRARPGPGGRCPRSLQRNSGPVGRREDEFSAWNDEDVPPASQTLANLIGGLCSEQNHGGLGCTRVTGCPFTGCPTPRARSVWGACQQPLAQRGAHCSRQPRLEAPGSWTGRRCHAGRPPPSGRVCCCFHSTHKLATQAGGSAKPTVLTVQLFPGRVC